MSLLIEKAAFLMSVQDEGRIGYRRYGLPTSGPMDWWAFRCANRLIGNHSGAACLEVGFSASLIRLQSDALIAVCGAGFELKLNHQVMPMWMAFLAKRGDLLTFRKTPGGNWAYLAAAGGMQSPKWLGSRSVYPRAELGGMLSDGDQVRLVDLKYDSRRLAGQRIPDTERPPYASNPTVHVIPGLHQARFQAESLIDFRDSAYRVSAQSDRMGYRLMGPDLKLNDGSDLISQGMVPGEIQVPRDGQPIVMMADHPTTGGYPCLGTVAKVDLPLLAQTEPLRNKVHFKPIQLEDARALLLERLEQLNRPIDVQEDQWLQL